MKTSIVMSTRNKWAELIRTLESIFRQTLDEVDFEVIVIDDGSDDFTPAVLYEYEHNYDNFTYRRLHNPDYRNPSVARNVGYRLATGKVIIAQSDDVIHANHNTISQLTNLLVPGRFLLATVWDFNVKKSQRCQLYTGLKCPRPFFFLGSLWRSDLYAVGGNDEEFVAPGYDDNWFADCLMRGQGLVPVFLEQVVGLHQQHSRLQNLVELVRSSHQLYRRKVCQALAEEIAWEASGGAWPLEIPQKCLI